MSIRRRSHLIIEGVMAVLLVAMTATMIGTQDAGATAVAPAVTINSSAEGRLIVHE